MRLRDGRGATSEGYGDRDLRPSTLHKWHSNVEELEASDPASVIIDTDQSYAKQQLGVKSQVAKLLGVTWNKRTDKIGVTFPCNSKDVATKRAVSSVYI